MNNLGKNKDFVIEKNKDNFYKLSNYKDKKYGGFTICAFSDKNFSNLIGSGSVSFNNLKNISCEGISKTNYNPNLNNFNIIQNLFENKGLMVHPNYQGYNIGEILVNLRKYSTELFFSKHKTILLTEIAVGNNSSLISSYKCGFKVLKKYIASDGVECFLLYTPLSKKTAIITGFNRVKSLIDFNIKKESKLKISEEEKDKIRNNFNIHIKKMLNIDSYNKYFKELNNFQLVNDCFQKQEKIKNCYGVK